VFFLTTDGSEARAQGFRKRQTMKKAALPSERAAHHSTAQHSTAQHSTAQHSTAKHSIAQHIVQREREKERDRETERERERECVCDGAMGRWGASGNKGRVVAVEWRGAARSGAAGRVEERERKRAHKGTMALVLSVVSFCFSPTLALSLSHSLAVCAWVRNSSAKGWQTCSTIKPSDLLRHFMGPGGEQRAADARSTLRIFR
jgi:hypothetical protein